jgi:hypothetical protein
MNLQSPEELLALCDDAFVDALASMAESLFDSGFEQTGKDWSPVSLDTARLTWIRLLHTRRIIDTVLEFCILLGNSRLQAPSIGALVRSNCPVMTWIMFLMRQLGKGYIHQVLMQVGLHQIDISELSPSGAGGGSGGGAGAGSPALLPSSPTPSPSIATPISPLLLPVPSAAAQSDPSTLPLPATAAAAAAAAAASSLSGSESEPRSPVLTASAVAVTGGHRHSGSLTNVNPITLAAIVTLVDTLDRVPVPPRLLVCVHLFHNIASRATSDARPPPRLLAATLVVLRLVCPAFLSQYDGKVEPVLRAFVLQVVRGFQKVANLALADTVMDPALGADERHAVLTLKGFFERVEKAAVVGPMSLLAEEFHRPPPRPPSIDVDEVLQQVNCSEFMDRGRERPGAHMAADDTDEDECDEAFALAPTPDELRHLLHHLNLLQGHKQKLEVRKSVAEQGASSPSNASLAASMTPQWLSNTMSSLLETGTTFVSGWFASKKD